MNVSRLNQKIGTMWIVSFLLATACSLDISDSSDRMSHDGEGNTQTDTPDDSEPTGEPDKGTDTSAPDDSETETGTPDAGAPVDTQDEGGDTDTDTGTAPSDELRQAKRLCDRACLDFPEYPIVQDDIPEAARLIFESTKDYVTPGPCIVEPQLSGGAKPGALFPANWLRPRFRFESSGPDDVYEIRLAAERQKHDLIVYTTRTTWFMPEEIWDGLRTSVIDEPITVTVRALNREHPDVPRGAGGAFSIAPVFAEGTLVYWATTSSNVQPDTSKLAGFAVGDEGTLDVLTIDDVGDRDLLSTDGRQERAPSYGVKEGCVQCIGCHTGTPDGEAVAFGDHWPWNVVVASVGDPATTGAEIGDAPSYLSKSAELLLNQPWLGMPAFSKARWNEDERILVTSYGERVTESGEEVGFTHNTPTTDTLAWFDLKTSADVALADDYIGDALPERNRLVASALGQGFGFLALTGERLSAVAPSWSNDGALIAYTAASKTVDGRLGGGPTQTDVDIHVVPFNDGQGGNVIALPGASEKETAEYYPAFSPDDAFIIFNREERFRETKTVTTAFFPPYDRITIDGSNTAVYYRPHAELYLIPASGGTPMRLAANDPPTCTGETSPGVINSWGKWAPDVSVSGAPFGPARRYYWVVFSSARSYPEQFIVERNQYSPPDTRSSQLYLAAIVRNLETGEVTNYPAIYIWNQDTATSNLTPAWGDFKLASQAGGES